MSTAPTAFQLPPPGEDGASVLARFRAARRLEDAAAREAMQDAAVFAGMHSADTVVEPAHAWQEKALPVGGEGCPQVAEWAVVEFAAVLGRSTESGRRYLARAVEARHRLPLCWARMVAGHLPAWKLARIAESTMCLPPEGARHVDLHLAPFAHKTGPAELDRIITAAKAAHDPEAAERDRQAAAEARHATLAFHDVSIDGTVAMHAELDLADALDLEAALTDGASERLRLGPPSPSTYAAPEPSATSPEASKRSHSTMTHSGPRGSPRPSCSTRTCQRLRWPAPEASRGSTRRPAP